MRGMISGTSITTSAISAAIVATFVTTSTASNSPGGDRKRAAARKLAAVLLYGSGNPVEVGFRTVCDIERNTLREFVGVQFGQRLAQPLKGSRGRLDHQQPLVRRFYLAFPAVDRFDLRNDVDARGQLPFD